jgi:cell division protein FtsB
MNRNSRINLLTKIAKKRRVSSLRGAQSRKSIEKHLSKTKEVYFKVSQALSDVEDKLKKLQYEAESLKDEQVFSKDEMKKCHEILSCLDLNRGIDEIKIRDNGDVLYVIKNRLHTWNPSTQEFEKAKKKMENLTDSEEDVVDSIEDLESEIEDLNKEDDENSSDDEGRTLSTADKMTAWD